MEDLASFDEDLSDCLYKLPTENLPLVSLQWTCSHETMTDCECAVRCIPQKFHAAVIFFWVGLFTAGGSRKGGS